MSGERFLWSVCGGFLFGVFARSVFPLDMSYAWFAVAMAAATLLLSLGSAKKMWRGALVAAALVAFAGGLFRMDGATLVGDPYLDAHVGTEVALEGVVFQEPDVREGTIRLSVRVERAVSSTAPVHAAVLAVLPPHAAVSFGDRVRVSGIVKVPENFDAGEGRIFNYQGYLAASGIGYQLERAQVEKVSAEHSGDPFSLFASGAIGIKQYFLHGLQWALPEPQSGLAGGLTAGDKRGLGPELTDEFRRVSLVHIIVLSGYNITVVASALLRVLARFPRSVRFAVGGATALFFALMTGGASASVRAAVMASIAMSAQASGRLYRADRALVVAAAGMAAWNPFLPAFDPGFQLSVLATAGLVFLAPLVGAHALRVPERFGLREIFISTTSAQCAVLPLLLYQSGQLSLVALPANLLALPAIPWAMFVSSVAGVAGVIFAPLSPIVAFPAYALLSYVLGVAHFFAQLPFAAVSLPVFSAWLLLPIYAGIFGYAIRYGYEKDRPREAGPVGSTRNKH